jgi:Skp family chaperone for outer membrane proteins
MANQIISTPEQLAADDAKKRYMEHVYGMTHAQLFNELMRVHGESAKMITELQAKVDELQAKAEDEQS